MPTLIPHMLTGALIQKAGGRRLWASLPLAVASHFWLDHANTLIYHAVRAKSLGWYAYMGFEVVVLAYFVTHLRRYWLGAVAAVLPDIEHVITGRAWTPARWGESAHNYVWYNTWSRTEWGLLIYVVMAVLIVAMLRKEK